MLRVVLWLFVGVLAWGVTFSFIECPDGNRCPDLNTCCRTRQGYGCCPYSKAMCCSDLTHCCPRGYRCNVVAQRCEKPSQPWLSVPMVKKEATEEPSSLDLSVTPFQQLEDNNVPEQKKSSAVQCDYYFQCPDGTTCCRHAAGSWWCCPYSIGRCCTDGLHCCPYGYNCDRSFQHCVQGGLQYPFTPKRALSSMPATRIPYSKKTDSVQEISKTMMPLTALTEVHRNTSEVRVIRCDSSFYCSQGSTCCKEASRQWTCCPYPLGQCCSDGRHCCEYGYTCDPSSLVCRKGYSQVLSGQQEKAKSQKKLS